MQKGTSLLTKYSPVSEPVNHDASFTELHGGLAFNKELWKASLHCSTCLVNLLTWLIALISNVIPNIVYNGNFLMDIHTALC